MTVVTSRLRQVFARLHHYDILIVELGVKQMTARAGSRTFALMSVIFITTSCGNGGGSSDGAIVTVPGGTSSNPPVTTPPTTVTPPPAPTVSYDAASDFTRDRSFTAIGYTMVSRQYVPPTTQFDQESASQGFDFIAATRQYTARYGGDAITGIAETRSLGGGISYDYFLQSPRDLSRSPIALGTDANAAALASTYSGLVTLGCSCGSRGEQISTKRYLLFGARTLASDLPTSGRVTKVGQSTLTSFAGGKGASASITIDYTARSVNGSTAFYPAASGGTTASQSQPITLAGVLDPATGRISGTATYAAIGATGIFEGALYGPLGTEVAILISIIGEATSSGGTVYDGYIGARN